MVQSNQIFWGGTEMKYVKILVLIFIMAVLIGAYLYFSKEDGKSHNNGNSISVENQRNVETKELERESTEGSEPITTVESESTTVIREEEYDLGNNNSMNVSVTEKDGKESLYISADIANEEKSSLAFIYLYTTLSDSGLEKTDYSLSIKSNSGMVGLVAGAPMGTNKDGGAVLSIPDWVIQDVGEITLSAEEQGQLIGELNKCMSDFLDIETPTEKVKIYEDEKVRIYFDQVTSEGVQFAVENLTDANITIQADTISINGESINKIIMSDDVAPQSAGIIVARCEVDNAAEVKTIGGQFTIIDFAKSFNSYKAKFVNVSIE